jgi:hypothetical protein
MSTSQLGSVRAVSEVCRFPAGLRKTAKRDALLTPKIAGLTSFFALTLFLAPALADPAKEVSEGPPPRVSAVGAYSTLNRLGDSDQETAQREGKLLAHHRTADPFGITVRGGLKDPLPIAEQPAAAPVPSVQSDVASQVVAPAVNVPTLEKAIEELTIGAVNPGNHQILVGSRSIREGDLVVLESSGHQFSVWVQSVGMNGVMFCDTDLQKHISKPFGFGPKELPKNSVWETSDLRNLLDRDAKH